MGEPEQRYWPALGAVVLPYGAGAALAFACRALGKTDEDSELGQRGACRGAIGHSLRAFFGVEKPAARAMVFACDDRSAGDFKTSSYRG